MRSICETLQSMPDKRRNCSPTIQLSIKRNATSRLRSHNGWRFGCNLPVCLTIGWIFVVARQISARSSQWKSPCNFRLQDGSRNTDCQTVLRKQEIEFQCGGELIDLGIS